MSSTPGRATVALWPLDGLRLTAGDHEVRPPSDPELRHLAAVATTERYDPSVPMFAGADDSPTERGRRFLRFHWQALGAWSAQDWSLNMFLFERGDPVGAVNLRAQRFPVLREVETGSWVPAAHRGRGLGTLMRTAVLELAFTHLGAVSATSAALVDNTRSLRVSHKLGYTDDGLTRTVVDGEVRHLRRLRLSREDWHRLPSPPVEVHGLPLGPFGLD